MVDAIIAASLIAIAIALVAYVIVIYRPSQRGRGKRGEATSGRLPYVEDDPSLPIASFYVNDTRFNKAGYRIEVYHPEEKRAILTIPYKDELGNTFYAQNTDIYNDIWIDPYQALVRGRIHAHLLSSEDKTAAQRQVEVKDEQIRLEKRNSKKLLERLEDKQKSNVFQEAKNRAEEGVTTTNVGPGGYGEKPKKDEDKDKKQDKDAYKEEEDEGSEYD